MGGQVTAEVYTTTEHSAQALLDEIRQAVGRVETGMSADAVGRVNREAARGALRLDRDLYRCIRLALDYAKASEGCFDPTVGPLSRLYDAGHDPSPDEVEAALKRVGWPQVILEREALSVRFRGPGIELDLGGIVHGYALDVAARNFALPGSLAGRLHLGNHLYVWGLPPEQSTWTVRLDDPREADRPLARLTVASSRGIALCGPPSGAAGATREAGPPVIDPRTGRPPASDVLVAVAVADSTADADAISTALFVGGSGRAGALLSKTRRVEAILLVRGERAVYLLASASLRGRFEPSPELANEAAGRVRYLLPPARGL